MTGVSEGEDLQALVQWALANVANVETVAFLVSILWSQCISMPLNVLSQGYSHGSLISSRHLTLPAPLKTYHVLISYPLGVRGLITLFHTGNYATCLGTLLRDPTSNVLIVYGTQDDFTSESSYDSWTEKLRTEVGDGSTARLEVQKVDGANHFWIGDARRQLTQLVESWLP